MRLHKTLIPIGALTLALGVGGSVANAQDRDGHDRGGRQSEGRAQRRSNDQRNSSRDEQRDNNNRTSRDDGRQNQANGHVERRDNRDNNQNRDNRDNNGNRQNDRRAYTYNPRYNDRGYNYRPRVEVVRPRYNRHYGPNFSVFFGVGSGYRYGSPYNGRVYGYVPAPVYGARIYYGDVRLQVRPRDAQVFVDGYYAGIVDDFDGIFQRLTLTVGPHEIEIEAPGVQPQVFNVYVDPARTVDVRADLYPIYP